MASTAKAGFDQFLGRLTPTQAARDKASTHRAEIETKLDAKLGVFQMFESGSFRHGTGVSGKSDVDYFVSLKGVQPTNSVTTLVAVRDALKQRFPSTYIHVSRPGVVLEFGGGYEKVEIIPAYYKTTSNGNNTYEIPGVLTEWLDSNPKSHNEYVDDCNKAPAKGDAKGLARLVKAWKYYRDVPISSFYLEMQAAKYTTGETSIDFALDMYYFLNRLKIGGLAAMNDPTGNTGRINPCSSDANKTAALSRLDTAVGRAERAKDHYLAGRIDKAFAEWDLLFNGQFPAYY